MMQSLKINSAHYTSDITSRGGMREGEGQQKTRVFKTETQKRVFRFIKS